LSDQVEDLRQPAVGVQALLAEERLVGVVEEPDVAQLGGERTAVDVGGVGGLQLGDQFGQIGD
jgi:hypothetical protein